MQICSTRSNLCRFYEAKFATITQKKKSRTRQICVRIRVASLEG
ncbi:hypothetical protein CAMSH0001_0269 [Campylobacter showae RM3277]|uniref:Uncharacterized protein n=1 Tax=Campylobacter showae RM3277 TaxID=553219 RepID=C6RIB6_9BACT|nr:hypothetical protein CAMSH0001_0269 [Campylobacter showae RM3277]